MTGLDVPQHIPVLLNKAIELLQVRPGGLYVDGTTGLGGHSEAILKRLQSSGSLLAIDQDADALTLALQRLQAGLYRNFEVCHDSFKNLSSILQQRGLSRIDGLLLDLGISSYQLDAAERGFSFQLDGPLDMRMNRLDLQTAADLINTLPESELALLLWNFGEERQARRIAAEICRRRRKRRIEKTSDLAGLVEGIKGRRPGMRIHPATQVFQALRIAVNQELAGLEEFLHDAIGLLKPAGRLVVISFHSLEDRLVKRTFRLESGRCVCFRPPQICSCPRRAGVRLVTAKPLRPDDSEITDNPRSRSARLRAVEKLDSTTEGQSLDN